jgi:hypothetical protein
MAIMEIESVQPEEEEEIEVHVDQKNLQSRHLTEHYTVPEELDEEQHSEHVIEVYTSPDEGSSRYEEDKFSMHPDKTSDHEIEVYQKPDNYPESILKIHEPSSANDLMNNMTNNISYNVSNNWVARSKLDESKRITTEMLHEESKLYF